MPSSILKVANIVELKGNDLIEMLDEFNKNLEEILSILYRHFTCGHTVEMYQHTLKELSEHTSHYFYCEDQWMHLTSYDEESIHKDEHNIFTKHFIEMQASLGKTDVNLSLHALLDLTKNFTQHVLLSDLRFRQYIVKRESATKY